MNQYLVIASTSPFSNAALKEALDMALIFAAIDQKVNLLLQGDALFALKSDQPIDTLGIKNYLKAFGTLSLYDIEKIFVCQTSMKKLNLKITDFAFDVETLNTNQKYELINQQTQVVTL